MKIFQDTRSCDHFDVLKKRKKKKRRKKQLHRNNVSFKREKEENTIFASFGRVNASQRKLGVVSKTNKEKKCENHNAKQWQK